MKKGWGSARALPGKWDECTFKAAIAQHLSLVIRAQNIGTPMLSDGIVVLSGPLGVARGTPNRGLAECRVTDTQHSKLGRQAIQVQADAVEIGIGSAAGEG